ncbi:tripartite tricarboxylate transporter substrate binding protein [Aquincola sp. S2]|uniref:Tripartite tricarboxylate transporter substrate binding protein n=1 Tax=Pseudaquabacterium terrae TaxID=2732868 RepID=A0ABX2EGB8_9BURK|nr:tripartite tricarboxylate transporter substrate binding protein [Aquabacterium terrae]NRF67670.1 tripartite tricarboxylate transporter substrate binding protein [Aquabacterium terrae]
MKTIKPSSPRSVDAARRLALLGCGAGLAALALPRLARAQGFPSKPITLVLPFPPGGSFDPILRALSHAAAKELGQPIVLLHKPGGGGVTGTASIATGTEADGHTIALMHNSVIRQPLLMKTAWDPIADFSYLIGLAGLTTGIVVAADAPWKTLAELLADAKARPGQISWGNVGAISVNRIFGERLAKSAGVGFNMIPFKGGSEAFQALLGRHLDVYGDPGFGAMATSGKVRLLASFTEQRLKRWPQVPTLRELGHDLVIESPIGLVAPKGLDAAVAARLHAAFAKAAGDAEYQRMLDEFDYVSKPMTGAAYRAYAVAQQARERILLAESGFKAE